MPLQRLRRVLQANYRVRVESSNELLARVNREVEKRRRTLQAKGSPITLPRLSAHVDVEMSGITAVVQRYIWLGKRIATDGCQNVTNNAREMPKRAKFPERGQYYLLAPFFQIGTLRQCGCSRAPTNEPDYSGYMLTTESAQAACVQTLASNLR